MACIDCNWGGWKCMTALTVVEICVAVFSSASWGSGLTEYVLKLLVDSVKCTEPCLKVVHLSFHDWQIAASVLYGFAVFFAVLSLLGLLSGQLSLQVPNVVFCIFKIVFTIFICERLLDAQQGPMMYKANRIFMYCSTLWNIITLCFNIRQVKMETDRIDMERSGRRPADIRILTEAFAPYFDDCNWCHCNHGNANTYEVNSNEIRVPIQDDSTDCGNLQPAAAAPPNGPVTVSSDVEKISIPPVVEASTPTDCKKQSVVDMGEGSPSDIENSNISDKRDTNDVKGSVASRLSEEMESSKAGEESRDRRYTSGDDTQSGKSANDSRDRNTDDSSEEVELQDEAPLLKNR